LDDTLPALNLEIKTTATMNRINIRHLPNFEKIYKIPPEKIQKKTEVDTIYLTFLHIFCNLSCLRESLSAICGFVQCAGVRMSQFVYRNTS